MTTKTFNKLENRVKCVNDLHNIINEIVPKLINELSKGFKIKDNGQLFKKYQNNIDDILKGFSDGTVLNYCYVKSNEYSIILNIRDSYTSRKADKCGCSGCTYYKKRIYLWDNTENKKYDFKELDFVSVEQLENAEKELEKLDNQKREIRDKIQKLEQLFD